MTATMTIKHYQLEAVEKIFEHWERESAVCVQFPTGAGKAIVVAELLKRLDRYRVLVLIDSQQHAMQLYHNLNSEFAVPIEIIDHSKEINWRNQQSSISTPQAMSRDNSEFFEHFDVLITYDLVPSKRNEAIQKEAFKRHKKAINIVSVFSEKQAVYLGKLIYQYTYTQAVRDGVIQPVDYIAGPSLNTREHLNRPWTLSALERFAQHFEQQDNHALIICRNIREAQMVKEVCKEILPSVVVALLHSKMPNTELKIREFINQDAKSIGIVVDMFSDLSKLQLTDVVLFRKFGAQHSFLQAVYLLRHGGQIWDFGGNRKYFEYGMGEVIEDNRMIDHLIDFDSTDVNQKRSNRNSGNEEAAEQQEADRVNEENIEPVASLLQKLANPCDDKPTQQDLLGRDGLVNILKGVIDRDARKHLIIALFGRWGSGKSSVINLLKAKYKSSKNSSFIIFNAWQEEHSASMAASLANKISDDLYQSKSFLEQLGLTLKYRLVESKWSLGFEFLLAISAASFAFLSLVPDIMSRPEPGLSSYFTGIALLMIPLAKSYWSHPFTSKVREVTKKSDFSTHLGINHQIREQLSNLLQIYPLGYWRSLLSNRWYPIPEQHKYIVVIDDLDRCSDAKIVETLEAMQLIVDIEGICVILAVDHQMLLDAVANRYKKQRSELSKHESQALARDFLGKILQLTITLDRPTDAKKEEFIHSRLYSSVISSPDDSPSKEKTLNNNELEFFTDLADPFNVEFFTDDMPEEFEVSTDYLSSTYEEYAFFKRCSDIFDVHNPRTLVRIHNSITLLKGLYPSVSDDSNTLKHYIYMVFWFEQYSAANSRLQGEMKTALFAENKPSSALWELFEQLEISTEKTKELRRILYRVKNLSLPSGSDLEKSELGLITTFLKNNEDKINN